MCRDKILSLHDLPPRIEDSRAEGYISIRQGTSLSEAERKIIQQTLLFNHNNKSRSAGILGIGRKTLHRKIDEYGL